MINVKEHNGRRRTKLSSSTPWSPEDIPNTEALYRIDSGLHTTAGSTKNLLVASENFRRQSGDPWAKTATITLTYEAGLGPDGYLNATNVVDTASNTAAAVTYTDWTMAPSRVKTFSCYIKKGAGHNGTSQMSIGFYTAHSGWVTSESVPTDSWTRVYVSIPATDDGEVPFTLRIQPDVDTGTQPILVTECQCEYDSATPTAYEANGPVVNTPYVLQWLDQSGNSRHYVDVYGSTPPAFETSAFNTYTGIKCPGNQALFSDTGFDMTTGITWVSVHRIESGVGETVQFGSWGSDDATSGWQFIQQGAIDSYNIKIKTSHVSGWESVDPLVAGGTSKVLIVTATRDGEANGYIDGALVDTFSASSWVVAPADQFKLVSTGNGGLVYIATEQWISRVITASEIALLNNYYTDLFL